jgi:integrase/recombinase XerD
MLRKDVDRYRATLGDSVKSERLLLMTQKWTPFRANTLCQLMSDLYTQAGLEGSHRGRRGSNDWARSVFGQMRYPCTHGA